MPPEEPTVSRAKAAAHKRLTAAHADLVDLSHRIHAEPELCFEEVKASAWLADMLDGAGFTVERGICDLPTAFVARFGHGPLNIGICAEYDALPDVGHACGHNLIATMAAGAGIAAREVADDLGVTISVIGTPAEEGGGGKILMLDRGGFAGINAAMMVHPGSTNLVEMPIIAAAIFDVFYHGKTAHASGYPQLGINAADALTVAQTAIGLLRQHIKPTDRVHGIVTKGGEAANIVPALTSAHYMVRASTLVELEDVLARVMRCFDAGAIATGCTWDVEAEKPYAEMLHDTSLAGFYKANFEANGGRFSDPAAANAVSTDMGNVSQVVPSIHPVIGLDCYPVSIHQPEFAAYCVTPVADRAIFDGALAMAWTAIDAATNGPVRDRLLTKTGPKAAP